MPTLSGSVGYDQNKPGANKIHDVSMIQVMLRVVKNKKGQAYVNFGYDGTCGKERGTHKAIKAFQTDMGLEKTEPHGLVRPGSKTLQKLVSALPATHKELRTLTGEKFVYVAGKQADATKSENAIKSHPKFQKSFATSLAKLVGDMFRNHQIVLHVVPGSGDFRSYQDQSDLYAKGRSSGGSVVTGAGPGESNHNYGNGVDIGFNGFAWVDTTSKIVVDDHWLNKLAKSSLKTISAKMWPLRNKLTTLNASGKSGDLIHLQSFSDATISMTKSLAALLTQVGRMKWERGKGEYRCDYGLGGKIVDIGSGKSTAQQIWLEKCDVSGTNLAAALNDATKRREKAGGKLPATQEEIYADLIADFGTTVPSPIKSSDLKKAQYNKMRAWLKKDFELAEADYQKWTAVKK